MVEDAEKLLQSALRDGRLKLPAGYYWEWSGQFENQQRAMARMRILVPVSLLIIFVILYLGFRRWWIAPIIYFEIIVAAASGFLILAWWGSNLSVAVWVGFLVLFGVAGNDGVLVCHLCGRHLLIGPISNRSGIFVMRCAKRASNAFALALMTICTTVFGLMPIFWSHGRGADVMQPMAIPSAGGMIVNLFITIFIVPCLFSGIEEWKWKRGARSTITSPLVHEINLTK